MNTGLLTVGSMLIGGVGASPASSNSSSTSNTNRFALTPSDGPYLGNNPEIATTDNKCSAAQIEPANEQPQNFRHALLKKIMPQTPQKGQDKTKLKTEGLISGRVPATNPPQPVSAQEAATVAVASGKVAVAKMINLCQQQAGSKTPNKPAELIATPKAQKLSPVSVQAFKLATTKPSELTAPTHKADVSAQALKLATTKPSELTAPTHKAENELLLTVDQNRPGLKAVSHDSSSDTLIAEPQSGEGKNVGKIQVSDKTFIATEYLTNQQSGKQLKTEPPGTVNKTIGGSAKMPVVDLNLPMREDNASQPQQKISVGQGKSALIADKPVESQANIGQQEPTTISQKVTDGKLTQIPSGLSQPNTKDQADNTPGDSIPQKLNLAWVQMSTSQTKDPGSSTADDGANPDFEQMPSHNSAQTLVTEQSFTSSQVAKTANNASTDDVSPDISTQLQGHIHSSLRQGDQQITIRLNPPELGKVLVRFQEQENQIIGLLEVSKAQTRYEIEQAIPQIIRNLQDSGVQIKRLEVVLTDQPEQQAYKDQSLQDGLFQPRGFSEGKHPDNTTGDGWLANDNSGEDISEPQMQITDNSINILI